MRVWPIVLSMFVSLVLVRNDYESLYRRLEEYVNSDPSLQFQKNTSYVKDVNPFARFEDYVHTFSEKVMVAGFRFESHKVLTDDGYILTVWRIPGQIGNYSKIPKKPVILQHGLLDDSYTFLVLNINKSLPLALAREGYDVWLPNVRGNIFSTEHIDRNTYDANKFYSKFWNFSFHDMAVYDLPAYIKYVKGNTGFEKIAYIGHSQGTLMFYLNFILDQTFLPQHVDKYVALGSVLTLNYINSPVEKLIQYTYFLNLLDELSINNIFNLGTEFNRVIHLFCKNLLSVCKFIISNIVQTKKTNIMDWKSIEGLFYYEPGGTSTKNMMHWIQNIRDKQVRFFDYGKKLNMQYYNQTEPPSYNVTKLKEFKIPSLIVAGDSDPFTQKPDFDYFVDLVPKEGKQFKFLHNYNHLDYCWADEAYYDIYLDTINFLSK